MDRDDYHWTIEQRLARELRELIVSGTLEPGLRLRYRDLATQFGVSITPVRAALRDLANEGLVEARPNSGARVSTLSLDELEELYLARIGFEPWLARLGAPLLSVDQLRSMEPHLVEFELMASKRDRDGMIDTGWSLRSICYEAALRPRLLERVRNLYKRARRYNRLTLLEPIRSDESRAAARDFYEACRKHDGIRAGESIRGALQRSFDDLRGQLES